MELYEYQKMLFLVRDLLVMHIIARLNEVLAAPNDESPSDNGPSDNALKYLPEAPRSSERPKCSILPLLNLLLTSSSLMFYCRARSMS